MTTVDLDIINKHKNWADEVYLNYCKELSPDQYNMTISGFGNSIKKILFHIYEVEWSWYMQFTGQEIKEWLNFDDYSIEELIKGIKDMNELISEYIQNGDLNKDITLQWSENDTPVVSNPKNMIFNYITHNAYHRGQLALLLRVIGIPEIKETDFNPYIYEKGQQ